MKSKLNFFIAKKIPSKSTPITEAGVSSHKCTGTSPLRSSPSFSLRAGNKGFVFREGISGPKNIPQSNSTTLWLISPPPAAPKFIVFRHGMPLSRAFYRRKCRFGDFCMKMSSVRFFFSSMNARFLLSSKTGFYFFERGYKSFYKTYFSLFENFLNKRI